jgi:hypothetical protein
MSLCDGWRGDCVSPRTVLVGVGENGRRHWHAALHDDRSRNHCCDRQKKHSRANRLCISQGHSECKLRIGHAPSLSVRSSVSQLKRRVLQTVAQTVSVGEWTVRRRLKAMNRAGSLLARGHVRGSPTLKQEVHSRAPTARSCIPHCHDCALSSLISASSTVAE